MICPDCGKEARYVRSRIKNNKVTQIFTCLACAKDGDRIKTKPTKTRDEFDTWFESIEKYIEARL